MLGTPAAVVVDEVDHVGVAVAAEAQQERPREGPDHALHQRSPPAVLRVVEVHDEPPPTSISSTASWPSSAMHSTRTRSEIRTQVASGSTSTR